VPGGARRGRLVGGQRAVVAGRASCEANSDHMGEEERGALADFRRHASLQVRHDLAVEFAAFEASHASGGTASDTDSARYVQETRASCAQPGARPVTHLPLSRLRQPAPG
jgi:hypothetical protein